MCDTLLSNSPRGVFLILISNTPFHLSLSISLSLSLSLLLPLSVSLENLEPGEMEKVLGSVLGTRRVRDPRRTPITQEGSLSSLTEEEVGFDPQHYSLLEVSCRNWTCELFIILIAMICDE